MNHQSGIAPSGTATSGTALLTDHYELTMVRAALRSGAARRRSVFEVFARHLPSGRRYGVVAGVGRLLDALERFRFGPAELEFLSWAGIADAPTRNSSTAWPNRNRSSASSRRPVPATTP